jgi:hypothetical protein
LILQIHSTDPDAVYARPPLTSLSPLESSPLSTHLLMYQMFHLPSCKLPSYTHSNTTYLPKYNSHYRHSYAILIYEILLHDLYNQSNSNNTTSIINPTIHPPSYHVYPQVLSSSLLKIHIHLLASHFASFHNIHDAYHSSLTTVSKILPSFSYSALNSEHYSIPMLSCLPRLTSNGLHPSTLSSSTHSQTSVGLQKNALYPTNANELSIHYNFASSYSTTTHLYTSTTTYLLYLTVIHLFTCF